MKVIGIDLGGMSAKAACLIGGKLSEKVRVKTSAAESPEETAEKLAALAREAAKAANIPFDEVGAVGIGSPGVVESGTGVVVNWTNFGWKNVPLGALVGGRLGKATYVLNDANAAALGEAKYGAGKRFSDCALLTLGTGIGSGILLGGKLFEGFRGAGTEMGHTVIREGGRECACGRRGCFECYASATALIRMTREAMEKNRTSRLWAVAGSPELADGRTAFVAAKEGDEAAKEVLDAYFNSLAEGIANLVNLMRPQAVILGGGISAEGEALLAPLRGKVEARLYVSSRLVPLELLTATLGNDAGIFGAAHFASEKI